MAKAQDGQYELVLENRHLLGIFFAAAVLCGVFFALGYIVGKNTGGAYAPPQQSLAAAPAEGKRSPLSPAPPPAAESQPQTGQETKAQPTEEAAGAPAATTTPAAPAPEEAKPAATGGITLQVAALSKKEDAEAMVALLKGKSFSVSLSTAAGDKLYHVQVGPFESSQDADAAKARLEKEGFKPILKR